MRLPRDLSKPVRLEVNRPGGWRLSYRGAWFSWGNPPRSNRVLWLGPLHVIWWRWGG